MLIVNYYAHSHFIITGNNTNNKMTIDDQEVDEKRYVVIPRTLIFLTRNDREVLLLKGSPNKKIWANKYNGIGGHIEHGEDVINSARRELKEEAGIDIDSLWICAIVHIDVSERRGILMFILRGDYDGQRIITSSEGKLEWVLLENIPNLPVVEDLKVILPRIMIMKKGYPPLSMSYHYDKEDNLKVLFSE